MIGFNLFGFKIKISFFFLFVLCFYLIIDKSGMIAYYLLFSVLHEMGHCVTYRLVAQKEKTLTLSPFGFGLSIDNASIGTGKYFFVLLSGPVINLGLLLLFYGFEPMLFWVNTGIFVINMLPIEPLDGGRMIKIVFVKIFGTVHGEGMFRFFELLFMIFLYVLVLYTILLCEINPSFLLFVVYLTFLFAKNS